MSPPPNKAGPSVKLSATAASNAIEELKRQGKTAWGATYYSQMAPLEICRLAGRPRQVQYGALISWLKRLGEQPRKAPKSAIDLVAHLTHSMPDDSTLLTQVDRDDPSVARRRAGERLSLGDARLVVNCPSTIHDYRFVVVGELPHAHLHATVLVQPLDGTGFWYPQVARHNPLRAGRAFACFVQIGNPAGIWHIKRPPLDAKVRVLALKTAWSVEHTQRMQDEELLRHVAALGLIAQEDAFTSRVSTDPLVPTLSDSAAYAQQPLIHHEPQARACVPPLQLNWQGGAAYVEIRQGDGDQLLFQGTSAPGAILTLHGQKHTLEPSSVLFELPSSGRYRVRLYPAIKSFVDPPYEWWLEIPEA